MRTYRWIWSLGIASLLATTAAASRVDVDSAPVDPPRVDDLTREQLAGLYTSLVSPVFQPPDCVAGEEMFDDVSATSPFCPWIEELARRGVTGGCTATEYCPNGPVSRAQMAVFVVRATADEAFHVVGEPDEPAFGDGGEGDCLWQNPPPESGLAAAANPTSFYKDSDGVVHLAGLPAALDGPGGDGVCDDPAGDISDLVIFELPPGYQPEHLEIFLSGNPSVDLLLVIPAGGVLEGGVLIPGGSVLAATDVEDGSAMTLDGITFRAAAATTSALSREPVSVSLEALREWRSR